MTPKQKQRGIIVVALVVITLAAIGLLIYASRSELNYYYSPVEVKESLEKSGIVIDENSRHPGSQP